MSIKPSVPDNFVSLEAMRVIFDVGTDTLYRMLRAEQLPCLTVGRLRKVPVVALARHIENAGMAESGQGVVLIRDAQRRAAGNETLSIDMRPPVVDRSAAVAKNVEAHEKNWADSDANEAAAKGKS